MIITMGVFIGGRIEHSNKESARKWLQSEMMWGTV